MHIEHKNKITFGRGCSYEVTVILYVQLFAVHLISNEPDRRQDQLPGHSQLYCNKRYFGKKY